MQEQKQQQPNPLDSLAHIIGQLREAVRLGRRPLTEPSQQSPLARLHKMLCGHAPAQRRQVAHP